MSEGKARLPVIIGVSRITKRKYDGTPSQFFAEALSLAVDDATAQATTANAKQQFNQSVTDVVTVRQAVEDQFREGSNCEPYKNLAQQIAKMSGAANETQRYYATSSGGSTPQLLVNTFAEKIAKGESECAVMVGGECLDAFLKQAMKNKGLPNWGGKYEEDKVTKQLDGVLGKYSGDTNGVTKIEAKNGLKKPTQMYPLLEQAYRAERSETVQVNIERNAKMFARFNEVASTKEAKLAWFPQKRTAQDIATESPSNRWVSFPYPKYMNAVMQVNQAACVILASEALADKLGVPKERRVYLRGCADAVEPGYYVSVRPRLGTSYAMTECLYSALRQAKYTPKDVSVFDLYSCFPIAVNVACDYLGINPATDPRPLTVTGGLPYYGGPGNGYVSCSIAAMVEELRKRPADQVGLVTANGWFLTKHSCGVYSRTPPPEGRFVREDPKLCQARADKRAGPLLSVAESPNGDGVIEAYIAEFSKGNAQPKVFGIGRLVSGADAGKRFVATLKEDQDPFIWMTKDGHGIQVTVSAGENMKNTFSVKDSNAWAKQSDSGVNLRPEISHPQAKL